MCHFCISVQIFILGIFFSLRPQQCIFFFIVYMLTKKIKRNWFLFLKFFNILLYVILDYTECYRQYEIVLQRKCSMIFVERLESVWSFL